ncbi:MAG: type II secretion system GspH family protein [Puniceicoccales bacterium]|nr:type II secretion system GspH family protein [Puniceicoccales bacterium]
MRYSKVGALSRKGFTLIEVVVTLCIVAILTAIAVPGFKKATEDFRLNATLEDTLDIMKACRAYYLIFNEFLPDDHDGIIAKLRPLLPSHLVDPTPSYGKTHRLNHRPLNSKSYEYHFNNFMQMNYQPHGTGVSLRGVAPGTADWNKCYNKFKSVIGERYISPFSWKDRMLCLLPECPGSTDLNSNTTWDNRYY